MGLSILGVFIFLSVVTLAFFYWRGKNIILLYTYNYNNFSVRLLKYNQQRETETYQSKNGRERIEMASNTAYVTSQSKNGMERIGRERIEMASNTAYVTSQSKNGRERIEMASNTAYVTSQSKNGRERIEMASNTAYVTSQQSQSDENTYI